jgi:hypothetical protein
MCSSRAACVCRPRLADLAPRRRPPPPPPPPPPPLPPPPPPPTTPSMRRSSISTSFTRACRRAGTAPRCSCSQTASALARASTATACGPRASGAPATTRSTWRLRCGVCVCVSVWLRACVFGAHVCVCVCVGVCVCVCVCARAHAVSQHTLKGEAHACTCAFLARVCWLTGCVCAMHSARMRGAPHGSTLRVQPASRVHATLVCPGALAIQVGVLGDEITNASNVVAKGRLGPGQMVVADIEAGSFAGALARARVCGLRTTTRVTSRGRRGDTPPPPPPHATARVQTSPHTNMPPQPPTQRTPRPARPSRPSTLTRSGWPRACGGCRRYPPLPTGRSQPWRQQPCLSCRWVRAPAMACMRACVWSTRWQPMPAPAQPAPLQAAAPAAAPGRSRVPRPARAGRQRHGRRGRTDGGGVHGAGGCGAHVLHG